MKWLDRIFCLLGVHIWANGRPDDWRIVRCTRCGRRQP